MSDFGVAPRIDWTLRGTPFESASFKWGLPLLPHLSETFLRSSHLPCFEVCMDRLLRQSKGSVDRSWAMQVAQKTDVCLHSRLANLVSEDFPTHTDIGKMKECIDEVRPRWIAFAAGFSAQRGQALQAPMPVPRTREMVDVLASRLNRLRDSLGCDLALTNVASMFRYSFDNMSETEFWQRIVDVTGVKLFFDIPAYYVSLFHEDLDFQKELNQFPVQNIMSVRMGALAISDHGAIDAECGRLSVTHWGLLEDVLKTLPAGEQKAIFLKWFEPLVSIDDLVSEIINGQSTLRRLGEI